VFDKSARKDGTFERSDFIFDPGDDSYICPGGKRLRPRNRNFTTARRSGWLHPLSRASAGLHRV
jgi:hypothetical protein